MSNLPLPRVFFTLSKAGKRAVAPANAQFYPNLADGALECRVSPNTSPILITGGYFNLPSLNEFTIIQADVNKFILIPEVLPFIFPFPREGDRSGYGMNQTILLATISLKNLLAITETNQGQVFETDCRQFKSFCLAFSGRNRGEKITHWNIYLEYYFHWGHKLIGLPKIYFAIGSILISINYSSVLLNELL